MHKSLVISFPNLTATAYCPCGYAGEVREGERAEQNASIDALAHFETKLPDEWAREASSLAKILKCPLCKTAMTQNEDGYVECYNHLFEAKDTKRATVLTLLNDYAETSSGLVVDLSWDNDCPVVNCPGVLLDRYSNYTDDANCLCSNGHEFITSEISEPFMYCELVI